VIGFDADEPTYHCMRVAFLAYTFICLVNHVVEVATNWSCHALVWLSAHWHYSVILLIDKLSD
jgi:hypothetical protein